jgi:hypothetical protein
MMEPERTRGITIISFLLVTGSVLGLVYAGSPVISCLKNTHYFVTAFKYLRGGSPWEVLFYFYQNFMTLAYLFTGIGVWRLKPWAWRFLLFLLSCEIVEAIVSAVNLEMNKNYFGLALTGAEFVVTVFLIIFFARRSIRERFSEEPGLTIKVKPESEKAFPGEIPAAAAELPPSANPVLLEKLKERETKQDRDSWDELERLGGAENFLSWAIMMGGILLSLKQKLGVAKGAMLGGLWGVESYILCFYLFRARKLPALVGGLVSIGLSFLLTGVILKGPVDSIWLAYGLKILPNFIAGVAGGALTRVNSWFHGSTAGVLWAVYYMVNEITATFSRQISFNDLDYLGVVTGLGIALLIGILSAALGGLLIGLILPKKN